LEPAGHGRWFLVANLPPVDVAGKRTYPRLTKTIMARLKREADAALADWLDELGQHDCADPDRVTVGEVLRRWLAEDAQRTVRPKTYERYAQLVDAHIAPALGDRRAAELTAADLSAFYADKQASGRLDGRKAGLSAQTCLHMHRVLHRAFQWAVDCDLMDRNPAARVRKPPSPARPRRVTWSDEQISEAIEVSRGTMVHIPAVLAGWAGMRRGEICGLTWDDVLWDAGAVVVRTSVEQTREGLHDLPTKTRAGDRVVLLPEQAIAELREHATMHDELRAAYGAWWNSLNRVVCRPDGSPMPPNAISNRWSEWVRRKKLEPAIRFHDLRHSHATTLYHAGARTRSVSDRLGHSTPAITRDLYIHGTDESDLALVRALEERIKVAQLSQMIRRTASEPVVPESGNTCK
jgi:integrase